MDLSPPLMPFIRLVIAFTLSGLRHSFCLISSPDPLGMAVTPSSRKALTPALSLWRDQHCTEGGIWGHKN